MNIEYLYKLGLSLLLSFFIGYERELQDKEAGLRTIMLISLGATTFTLLPFILLNLSEQIVFDFSRIISYTIAGCGFLSGVVIINNKKKVEGITTSACLWAIVAMSILSGLGEYLLAIIVALSIYLILKLKYVRIKIIKYKNGKEKR